MPVSRARCDPLLGTLLVSRSVKLKDKMLGAKEGPVQVTAQVFRGTNSMQTLGGSWKGKKSSNYFQMVPSGLGYLEPIEESTWSKNHDSAASMFPPSTFPPTLDLWEENFQDLSVWCHKPLQDMSSVMVDGTKGSNCIVHGDELNTPDIGIKREFNFTTPAYVSQGDTSPCEFDGEGWKALPPLDLPQVSSIAEDKSLHTASKADSDNSPSKSSEGFFVDEAWGLSVSHEEEIVSSHNQEEKIPEFVQNKETDIEVKTSVNIHEVGVELSVKSLDFNSYESLADSSPDAVVEETVVTNESKDHSLESMLVADYNVQTLDNSICSLNKNQEQTDSDLSLKNLLAGKTCEINTNTSDDVESVEITTSESIVTNKVTNTSVSTKSRANGPSRTYKMTSNVSGKTPASITTMIVEEKHDTVHPELQMSAPTELLTKNLLNVNSEYHMLVANVNERTNNEGVGLTKPKSTIAPKKNLKLNLSTQIGMEEIISTPVVLEPLFKEDGSFDLLDYVFNNNRAFSLDSPDVKFNSVLPITAADLTDRAPTSVFTTETICKVEPTILELQPNVDDAELLENEDDSTVNLMVVKPFVIEKSLDGQWSISQTEEIYVDEDEEEAMEEEEEEIESSKVSYSRKTDVLSSHKQVTSKKRLPDLKVGSSPKQPRGRPAKRSYTSTSKEETVARSTNKSRRVKLSSSSSSYEEPLTPPSKRSRQSSVDSDCDKYRELRDRNNEASRKSRQNRKARECDMKSVATKLERENQSLKIKADEMERLVKKLREALLEAVVKIKKE